MARSTFGGGAADFLATVNVGGLVRAIPGTLTFWSASSGGAQYTDLLLDGSPVSSISVGSNGQVPLFQGPDGVGVMWADAGHGRVRLISDKTGAELASDAFIAETLDDPDSDSRITLDGLIEGQVTTGIAPIQTEVAALSGEVETLSGEIDATAALTKSAAGFSVSRRPSNVVKNLLTNPSMSTGSTGWTTSGYGTGGAGSAAREAGVGAGGSYGWVTTWSTPATAGGVNLGPYSNRVPVTEGKIYVPSIYVQPTADCDMTIRITWFSADNGSAVISSFDGTVSVRAGKLRRRSTNGAIAPAGALFASVTARLFDASAIGTGSITVSRAMLTEGPQLTPYRDGDDSDATWDGTAGASASTATILSNRYGVGVAFGDSLTQYAQDGYETYPNYLSDLLGIPVNNRGRGGETSTGVAIRQGGLDLRVTVDGNEIPTSGPVSVTVSPATTYRGGTAWNFYGSLAGISGQLSRASGGTWTFTRTVAGAATGTIPGIPWRSFDVFDMADFVLLWAGHNLPDQDSVLRDIGAMAQRCRDTGRPFFVLSVLTRTDTPSGTADYETFMGINAALNATYGAAFLDVRRFLIDDALSLMGITPTTQDGINIAADTMPSSLMYDSTHLNRYGREAVARYLAAILTARGFAD